MKKLIYIVEDDVNVCDVISMTLELSGYRTKVFNNPARALDALGEDELKPDLLLTDYQMPGMNGLELIQHFKADLPLLKTISISGTLPANEIHKYPHKPDQLLAKPFRAGELLDLVKRLLS